MGRHASLQRMSVCLYHSSMPAQHHAYGTRQRVIVWDGNNGHSVSAPHACRRAGMQACRRAGGRVLRGSCAYTPAHASMHSAAVSNGGQLWPRPKFRPLRWLQDSRFRLAPMARARIIFLLSSFFVERRRGYDGPRGGGHRRSRFGAAFRSTSRSAPAAFGIRRRHAPKYSTKHARPAHPSPGTAPSMGCETGTPTAKLSMVSG